MFSQLVSTNSQRSGWQFAHYILVAIEQIDFPILRARIENVAAHLVQIELGPRDFPAFRVLNHLSAQCLSDNLMAEADSNDFSFQFIQLLNKMFELSDPVVICLQITLEHIYSSDINQHMLGIDTSEMLFIPSGSFLRIVRNADKIIFLDRV